MGARPTFLKKSEHETYYCRMIIVLPYRSSDKVKQVENSFEQINLKCLNLPNPRYLSTKELTKQE